MNTVFSIVTGVIFVLGGAIKLGEYVVRVRQRHSSFWSWELGLGVSIASVQAGSWFIIADMGSDTVGECLVGFGGPLAVSWGLVAFLNLFLGKWALTEDSPRWHLWRMYVIAVIALFVIGHWLLAGGSLYSAMSLVGCFYAVGLLYSQLRPRVAGDEVLG